jgi:hypothetical protein
LERNIESPAALESSLIDLHSTVDRLIKVMQENASGMERGQEILDKLPLLDFYNDDLKRNIASLRGHRRGGRNDG